MPERSIRTRSAGNSDTSTIPLVDLAIQQAAIDEEVREAWAGILARSAFVLGDEVDAFERAYARFCGVEHCVGVANGTDALELAMRGAGVGPGDEVVVPTNSFVASAAAVVRTGATPVLVDIDPATYLIDVAATADRITPRTRAILAVDLYGQPAPIEELRSLMDGRGLVIADAAQSHGARRGGAVAGSLASISATSFYPGKNLGAYGDAGAVLTHDGEVASRVRELRNHGGERKYDHHVVGFNSRMDTFQAAVLLAKLGHLDPWTAERRAAADRYLDRLSLDSSVGLPRTLQGNEHVWHLFVIRIPNRDEVLRRLNEAGIGASIHYPTPIHLLGAFRHLGHRDGDFPVAEVAAREILSLPIYPGITEAQQDRVVEALLNEIADG
jgi:dTDP-4-amino-4,6-dideoxygalactose transaminase